MVVIDMLDNLVNDHVVLDDPVGSLLHDLLQVAHQHLHLVYVVLTLLQHLGEEALLFEVGHFLSLLFVLGTLLRELDDTVIGLIVVRIHRQNR